MEEEWKVCFEKYEISNLGNCRRKLLNNTYRNIKGSINNRGYKYIQLNRDNKKNNYLIHYLVCKCFLGERPDNLVIDHIDRDKLNNNINNLRYITQAENSFNCDRVISSIPQNTPDRKRIIQKIWIDKNKEIILEKKKQYHEDNKEKIKEKRKNNKITLNCENCKKDYIIQKHGLKYKKTNNCSECSSKLNLPKK